MSSGRMMSKCIASAAVRRASLVRQYYVASQGRSSFSTTPSGTGDDTSSSSGSGSGSTPLFQRPFSSLEYPLRTEAPAVTTTLASEVSREAPSESPKDAKRGLYPTDDLPASVISTRIQQPQISRTPPSHIPPNVPFGQLEVPETLITQLDNGVRVASQETYGQVTTIGLVLAGGSRHETVPGVSHVLELLAFGASESYTDISAQVLELGGSSFCSSGREQSIYSLDVLRPNLTKAMPMLADALLRPLLGEAEIEQTKRIIEFQWMDVMPEVRLNEGLQMAAYGPLDGVPQQLGRPHFCPTDALEGITPEALNDFRRANLLDPTQMVVAAAGMEHDALVEMSIQYFGHLEAPNPNEATKRAVDTVYTGGDYRLNMPVVDGFTRVAMAWELGGWHSDDLVPACVLQTLLGGGSSFSAGGPGKGMYSRLYREVLNRFYWAESAEAFNMFHGETGLVGLSGSAPPEKARDVTRVLAEHMARLALEPVTDEELSRARNMLKCNVLTQLESRLVLFEDIGRQILTYGKREGTAEMCAKIDAVTAQDIQEIARKAITKPPTLASVGENISNVPAYEEIASWFSH